MKRVLIFNCTHGRTGSTLLGALLSSFKAKVEASKQEIDIDTFFDDVIFCTNVTYSDGTFKGGKLPRILYHRRDIDISLSEFTQKGLDEKDLAQLKTQTDLAAAWKELVPSFPEDHIHVLPSIQHAVNVVGRVRKANERPVDVLVTGSLLLVGGLIEVAGLTKAALEI